MADETTPDDPDALAQAKALMSEDAWPRTVKLGTPIEFGKTTIESLTFQRGTLGVLKGMGLGVQGLPSIDQLVEIASKLTGQPIAVIEKLSPDDADEVITLALGFFARCRGGGKKL